MFAVGNALGGEPVSSESCHQCHADMRARPQLFQLRRAHSTSAMSRPPCPQPVPEKLLGISANTLNWCAVLRSRNPLLTPREKTARDQLKKLFGDLPSQTILRAIPPVAACPRRRHGFAAFDFVDSPLRTATRNSTRAWRWFQDSHQGATAWIQITRPISLSLITQRWLKGG